MGIFLGKEIFDPCKWIPTFDAFYLFCHLFFIKPATIVLEPGIIDVYSSALEEIRKLPRHIVFDYDDFVSFFLELFNRLCFERPDIGVVEIVAIV